MPGNNIDTRIVEMKFDNSQFERNIKQSQKSLEDFKEELDFEETSRGMEKFSRGLDALKFDSLTNNIQKITDKFTGLGNAAEFVLSRIRNSIESTAIRFEQFLKNLTFGQIQVGQNKFDAMTRAVQTMVAGGDIVEEDAYEIVERIQKYTDQTSHSFETMITQLANMTSSGKFAKGKEGLQEAELIIEAIGNASTKAGADAQHAAGAMEIWSKVIGSGSIGRQQFESLQNTYRVITAESKEMMIQAGLATGSLVEEGGVIKTAAKYGKQVEVSVGNIAETLQKHWLDSDTILEYFSHYRFGDTLKNLERPDEAVIVGLEKTKEEIAKEMQDMFPQSNVDLLKRKVVKMGDDIATVLTETFTASKDGSEGLQWNQDLVMNIATITPDGKPLDENTVQEYVESLLKKSANLDDLLKNDRIENGGKGLIISADVDFKSFKEGIKNAEDLAEALHKLQEQYYSDGKKTGSINTEFGRTAYLTGQRALSFADAMNAVKESISGEWVKTFQYLIGPLSEAAEFFTVLCERIIETTSRFSELRNSILSVWSEKGGRKSLISAIFGDYINDVKTGAYGLLDVFDSAIDAVSHGFWRLMELFANSSGISGDLWNSEKFIKEGGREGWIAAKLIDFTNSIQKFMKGIKDFFHEEVDVGGQVKTRLQMVQEVIDGIVAALKFGYDILVGVIVFADLIRQDLQPAIDAVTNFFAELGAGLYSAESDASKNHTIIQFFTDLHETVQPLTSGFNDLIVSLTNFLLALLGMDKASNTSGNILNSLKNFFLTLTGVISAVGGPVLSFLGKFFDALTWLISGDLSPERIEEFGRRMGEAFRDMLKGIADSMPENLKEIGNYIRDLFGLWGEGEGEGRDNIFTKIHDFLQGGVDSIKAFFTEAFGEFEHLNLLTLVKDKLGLGLAFNFLQTVGGWFKGTNLYGVILAFLGVASLVQLVRAITMAKGAFKNIRGFFEDVGGNIKAGVIGEYEYFSEKLINIAKAVAIVAASIFVLGLLKPERLIPAVIALGLVIGALALFAKYYENNVKGTWVKQATQTLAITALLGSMSALILSLAALSAGLGMITQTPEQITAAVLGLGAIVAILGVFMKTLKEQKLETIKLAGFTGFVFSLGLLILALVPLALMSWGGWARSMAGLVVVLSILIGAMKLITIAKVGDVKLLGFIGFAFSLGVLMYALIPLALMDWGGWARSMVGLALVISMIIGAMKLVAIAKVGDVKLAGFIGFAFSLGILMYALVPLSNMDWGGWARSMAGLAIALGLLIGAMKLIAVAKIGEVKLLGFVGFAFSLSLLIVALTPLALMDWGAWSRSMAGLALVLGMIVGTMKLMAIAKIADAKLAGFVGFVFSLGILMVALTPIANMDWGGWTRAMVGLALVLAMIVGTMKLIEVAKVGDVKLVGFIGFAASIGILLLSLSVLANHDLPHIQGAVLAFMEVLMMLAAMMVFINKTGSSFKASKIAGFIVLAIAISTIMFMFSVAINEVRDVNWTVIVSFAAGLAVVVAALGFALPLLSKIPLIGALKAILILGVAIAALAVVLDLIGPLIGEAMRSVGAGMADFTAMLIMMGDNIQRFSDSMNSADSSGIDKAKEILGHLKDMFGALIGFGNFTMAINNFSTALFDLSTGLEIFQGHTANLEDPNSSVAFKMIQRLIDYQPSFAAFSIGNFADQLTGLAAGLYLFDYAGRDMADVQDSKALNLLTALAGCAGDIQTLTTLPLDQLKGQLAGLGGAMTLYAKGAEEATGLTAGETTDVSGAVTLMQEVMSAFGEAGGFTIPDIPDEAELAGFGADLAALAGAIVQFANASNGLDSNTDKAKDLLTFMQTLRTDLTNENLAFAKAFDEAGIHGGEGGTLDRFATDITALGLALSTFADSTKTLDEGNMQTARDSLGFFKKLRDDLSGIDFSIVDIFFDAEVTTDVLTEFGTDIEQLGLALAKFAQSVTWEQQKSDAFQKAMDSLDLLVQLQNKLPDVGGLWQAIAGHKKSYTEVSAELINLGNGMADFAKSMNGEGENSVNWNDAQATQAITILEQVIGFMSRLSEKLPNVGGLANILSTLWSGSEYSVSQLATDMGSLGTAINNFNTNMGELRSTEDIRAGMDVLMAMADIMATFTQLENIDNGIYDAQVYVGRFIDFIDALNNGFDSLVGENPEHESAVKGVVELMNQISTEMAKYSNIDPKSISIFKTMAEAINQLAQIDPTINFENVGKSISTGIANGITNSLTVITIAARNAAIAAYNAAMEALDANSPSKLFIGVGGFITDGMAIGITKGTKDVDKAAFNMADGAGESAMDAMAIVSRLLSEDIDANPTITPVLNLDNVAAGLNTMHGMLDGSRGMTIDTTSIRRYAASNIPTSEGYDGNQNGTNYNGIYERMSSIGEKLSELGEQISNMKIYLNTGVVAGGVTDDVDMNIGRKTFYAGRNN